MDISIIDHRYFQLFERIAGLLALISFFYCILVFIKRQPRNLKTNFHEEKLTPASPPEVAGAWPIVGHLPQLNGSTPLFKILADMSDKYGPIFIARFGMYPTLVISSWEMSKECFSTNDRLFATRPPSAAGKYLAEAMFGFSPYGPYWREVRKIATLHLLSHKRLEFLKPNRYLEIDNCMTRLYDCWMERDNLIKQNGRSTTSSVKVDMSQVFSELSLNVVLKMIVGKTLFTKKNKNKEDYTKEEEEGQKLHKSILKFFELAGVSVASDTLPFLGWLDVDGQTKQMKRLSREMNLIVSKWLEEHQEKKRLQTLESDGAEREANDHKNHDFMDVLMSVLDEEKEDLFFGYNRDTVIKGTCLNLILAASDTTSVTLTWALSLVLTNPSVLKMAQDELDTEVGKERNVEGHDIDGLVYLQAIVKETLRLYPPGPLSVPHEATEDCIVGGYEVKKGTRLLVNLWKLQRDARVWSNPLEFKPERFLPETVGGFGGETAYIDFRGQHYEYTPFGSGRRGCPGIDFGLQTLHMALARLLHAFDFDTDRGFVIDMTEGPGFTMPKVTPLEVHLIPRLPATLY
ncbi:hypothetical protein C5167_021173 [Papaver somniferum]|uniref:Cytochrome P450 n=2 Tax=Papaver somniferum TaxID=3469 RepID=A0A4Y7IYF7_PAPSO|nr:hypothetical protein C5167_021171 [Papaver somniferum]RZC52741.1 hypothetical protein C5167_021173 [Papaver somniferum]